MRRFDEGTLSTAQEDRLGTALMLLDERMDDLCAQHGLSRSDLNLDLPPGLPPRRSRTVASHPARRPRRPSPQAVRGDGASGGATAGASARSAADGPVVHERSL